MRVAARAGRPKQPDVTDLPREKAEKILDKWGRDVEAWTQARDAANAALIEAERVPDRFVAGVTSEIPNKVPTDAELAALGREIEDVAKATPGVMAIRAASTTGEFMGDKERALDFEMTTRNGYDAEQLMQRLAEIGDRMGQEAVFLSRVLRPEENPDPARHRPGMELYFPTPVSGDRLSAIMEKINAAGVHGMTLATEGRRTSSMLAGETQPVIGVRIQYIPELASQGGTGYNPEEEISAIKDKMADLVKALAEEEDISTVSEHWYETEVHFYGDSDRTAAGVDRAARGEAWAGESVRQGLERSARFYGTPRQEQLTARRDVLRRGGEQGSDGAGGEQLRGSSTRARVGTAQDGSVSVEGIHFSREQRGILSSAAYGTGLDGAERERLALPSADPRIRQRIHFYVNEGQGIKPEAGVGYHAHALQMDNLYDWKEDPLNLWASARQLAPTSAEQANLVEAAVLDAGFDGVYARGAQAGQGVAVLLGPHNVQPDYLGLGKAAYEGAAAAPAERVTDDKAQVRAFLADKAVPAGQIKASGWPMFLANHPALRDRLQAAGAFEGDERLYKDQLARKLDTVKASTERLLAPNGKPSKLTPEQHAQVRTPAFKKWFGDWEAFAAEGRTVWEDDKGAVSKVVDPDTGEPLVVYHGSPESGFAEFEGERNPRGTAATFFSDSEAIARTYSGRRAPEADPGSEDRRPGLYPVFLNIRDPYEEHFEGANWDGSREGQFIVQDENGDPVYAEDGSEFFNSKEEARRVAEENNGEVWDAPEFFESTNSVVERARRNNDGAIMRSVVDNGALADEWIPSDVFAVFKPSQIKSATRNTGAFDPANPDIRASSTRIPTKVGEAIDHDNGISFDPIRQIRFEEGDMDRGGLAERGLMGHGGWVEPGNKLFQYAIYDDGKKRGDTVMELDPDGNMVALHDIQIYTQGRGTGSRAIQALLDNTNRDSLKIIDILDQSRPFWEKQNATEPDADGNAEIIREGSIEAALRSFGAPDVARAEGASGLEVEEGTDLSDEELRALGFKFSNGRAVTDVDGVERPALNSEGRPIHPTEEGVRNFWRWFGNSKAVDAEGRPKIYYHATPGSFGEFRPGGNDPALSGPAIWVTDDKTYQPAAHNVGRRRGHYNEGTNVMPLYLRAERPLLIDDQTMLDWARAAFADGSLEFPQLISPAAAAAIREEYDAIFFEGDKLGWGKHMPGSANEFITFEGSNLKSAIGNDGGFHEFVDDVRYSSLRTNPKVLEHLSPDQIEALRHVGGIQEPMTWREKFDQLRTRAGERVVQGLFDQFAPLKNIDYRAYMQARMSRGSDGALEATLLYGKPFVRGDSLDVDVNDTGFLEMLQQADGEHDLVFQWIAANRAEKLLAEGKEFLYTPDRIRALKRLNQGTMADGRSRAVVYGQILKQFNQFQKAILDIAQARGIIDPDSRAVWESEFYVPFYRNMQDGTSGPSIKSGLVRQYAYKKLKGSSKKLQEDLLANVLQNWAHLLSASAKNQAAKTSLEATHRLGYAHEVPAHTKGAVFYLEKGDEKWFAVDDPLVLDAITALESINLHGYEKVMSKFKQYLTFGVTVNPTFKVRNLIRDSIAAIAISPLSKNIPGNVKKGWQATEKKTQTYASMLASGGMIRFGTLLEGNRADHARRLIEDGVKDETILNTQQKVANFIKGAFERYQEFGDRLENINRATLFERTLAKTGGDLAQAAFDSRDLMDFSSAGVWPAIRLLSQVVPFMNARLQGLYKLGRGAAEDPKRFATVTGAVMMASMLLLLAGKDDEDWKAREEWDRDAYWWFKIGGVAYRIPKPFEVGALGTLAERGLELAIDDEMTGQRFASRLGHMLSDTFAMNPTPQIFKPWIDIRANRDSFTDRPIESLAMEKLRPEDRFNAKTSELARVLSAAGLPNPFSLAKAEYEALSPVQIDHLIRAYFSWAGTFATQVVDLATRASLVDRPAPPAPKLRDVFFAGNFVETLPAGSSRYLSEFYDTSQNITQDYMSWRQAVKLGETERAAAILEERPDLQREYKRANKVRQRLTEINAQVRQIEASRDMTPQQKREAIDKLQAQRNNIARMVR